jgi:hypothetical protein
MGGKDAVLQQSWQRRRGGALLQLLLREKVTVKYGEKA